MNRPSRLASIIIAAGAAFALLLVWSPNQAGAQIRPAIVKNIDEPGRIPWQQYVSGRPVSGSPNCGLNYCTFYLPTVPAGKRLVITDFYGTVSLETTAAAPTPTVNSLRLFAVLNSPPWTRTAEFEVPPNPPAYYNVALTYQLRRYPFGEKVQMYVEAGLTPVIDFWTGSGYLNPDWNSVFTVVGYLVDLNQ